MHKPQTHITVVIASETNKNEYWQCGIWVRGKQNATKYPCASEAEAVTYMRGLKNVRYEEA